jgi:phosphatidylinositol glycan class W
VICVSNFLSLDISKESVCYVVMLTEKELFYTGHQGGRFDELACVLSVGYCAFALSRSVNGPSWVDVVVYCLSWCLAMTLLSDHVLWLCIVLVLAAFVARFARNSSASVDASSSSGIVSAYRGSLMVATCISILAVDFSIFPRRFGKTEEFGFSLMDLGVGSFVFSSGLVARSSASLWRAAVESAIVLALAVARLIVTTLVGYHQHVSEYGTHWNFFLTLGVVLFVARALRVESWRSGLAGFVGVACIGVLQVVFVLWPDVIVYVFSAERMSLFSHNREGIVSLVGFWSILLFGVDSGKVLRTQSSPWLLALSVASGVACFAMHFLVQAASRRLANAAYCCCVVSLSCFVLSGFSLMDALFPAQEGQDVFMTVVSKNQLVMFVLANLATGVVNMSINTISQSSMVGFGIVMSYTFAVSGAVLILTKKSLLTKK